MTDAIKKMLEPKRYTSREIDDASYDMKSELSGVFVDDDDVDCIKRGFLKLMDDRDMLVNEYVHGFDLDVMNAELEKAMRDGE